MWLTIAILEDKKIISFACSSWSQNKKCTPYEGRKRTSSFWKWV